MHGDVRILPVSAQMSCVIWNILRYCKVFMYLFYNFTRNPGCETPRWGDDPACCVVSRWAVCFSRRKAEVSRCLNSALLLISDSTKHLYQRNGLHTRCTVLRVEVCGTFRSPPSFLRLAKDTINVTACQLLYINRWFEVDDAHSRWQEGGRMLEAFRLHSRNLDIVRVTSQKQVKVRIRTKRNAWKGKCFKDRGFLRYLWNAEQRSGVHVVNNAIGLKDLDLWGWCSAGTRDFSALASD
jgi:hypothetical protein